MAITIKAARVNAGYTQKEVHELTGIERTAIARYENNPLKIPSGVFLKLCELYGVSVDDIFMPEQ